jgi:thiamine biosynthesis lipoprotein
VSAAATLATPAAAATPRVVERHVHAERVMGTVVSFDLRGERPVSGALDRAVARLHDVDARFSSYRADSEVSRLADGTLTERDAHPDVRAVLAMCDALQIDSGGAFDARRWSPDGRLDPSGLVKGWAVQRAADELAAAGLRDFAIDAGGDLVTRGEPEAGRPWRVGIRHPGAGHRVAAVLAVGDLAVATSGLYERGPHIRDPRTHRATRGLQSLTVAGPSLTWVDAYATTAFVMGLDGLSWVADHAGFGALAITSDDRMIWTPVLQDVLAR